MIMNKGRFILFILFTTFSAKICMPEINLIKADCMEIMPTYPDKYFDLAIIDPPYGLGVAKWDIKPNENYFKELFRVSRKWLIWGANYFNIVNNNNYIIWDK